jgi:phage tail-like protein
MATDSIINRFSTLATDPLRSFRFYAEFSPASDGVFDNRIKTGASNNSLPAAGKSSGFIGGFTNISGLSINTQSIQYREGGYNTTVHQVPGMTTFTPISLQRGVLYGNDQAITWMRGLFAAAQGDGLAVGANKGFRCNVDIFVLAHPNANPNDKNTPRMGFKVHNAWIASLSYSDLNAGDNQVLFESMQLVHEGLSVFFTDSNFNAIK